jgi:hypothetical protein
MVSTLPPRDSTPAHYREMARREMAERSAAPSITAEYLQIARAYESLANHAERRVSRSAMRE